MRMQFLATWTATVLSALAACSAAGDRNLAEHLVVRDSLGIAVYVVDLDAVPLGLHLDSVPRWSLGGSATDELQLHNVLDAIILADGRRMIVEGSTQQLIWFDPSTTRHRRIGGRGDGPAEFRQITHVSEGSPGRFRIFDGGRRRYVDVNEAGEVIRDATIPTSITGAVLAAHPSGGDSWYLILNGALEDVGEAKNAAGSVVGVARRPRVALVHWVPEGGSVDSLVSMYGAEMAVSPDLMAALVFGANVASVGSAGGVWIGDTALPEVRFWANGGGTSRIVRWTSAKPRAVTEIARDGFWNLVVERENADVVTLMRPIFPFREEFPWYERLIAGPGGELWIGSYTSNVNELAEAPHPEQEWVVIDFENEQVGKVRTPKGFRLLKVTDDGIVGAHRDELGIESVRQYSLRRDP